MRRTGQEERLRYYLQRYQSAFDEVLFFSYDGEDAEQEQTAKLIPRKLPLTGSLYSLSLPLVCRKELVGCNLLRALQLSAAVPAALAKYLYGVPYAITFGYDALRFARAGAKERASMAKLNLWLASRSADVIFCSTPSLKEQAERLNPRGKVLSLPNAVDLRLFKRTPVRTKPRGRWKILSVGRLATEKNYSTLIDALSQSPNVELHLAGSGPEEDALEERARQMGVPLKLHGTVPQTDLPSLLADSDLFVLPSLLEGHPKVLLEAMASGLPCLGTDVPGIRDTIDDGINGVLVSADAAALRQGVERLLKDRSLASRLGTAAHRHVEQNHDLDSLLDQELRILTDLAAKQNVQAVPRRR